MKVYDSITQLIGKTPLLELKNYNNKYNLGGKIFAKLEYFNPAGSIKDRIALAMIVDGEERGIIGNNTVIIEPTSGNTGIGLALVCAVKKLRLILTMPETMSIERRKLLAFYGAEIVLTDRTKGMQGAVEKANELKNEIKNSFIPYQFSNKANPKAHRETTAKEIYEDIGGNIDIFVAGVGSAGTISGIGEYLKAKNKDIKVVAVEPEASPLLSQGRAAPHRIQGIGANFVPENLNRAVIDEIITVSDEDAFAQAKEIAKTDGTLVGISSGAALYAAKLLASREENKDKNIVVIFPDGGDRYLSTELFE